MNLELTTVSRIGTITNQLIIRKDNLEKIIDIHTNSIGGFWSNLKRGIYGIYHHISTKHIQNYMNEFCFRYNERDNNFVFDKLIRQCVFINA